MSFEKNELEYLMHHDSSEEEMKKIKMSLQKSVRMKTTDRQSSFSPAKTFSLFSRIDMMPTETSYYLRLILVSGHETKGTKVETSEQQTASSETPASDHHRTT